MSFKNQKEIMQALLDSKKIYSNSWPLGDYIYLDQSDGYIKDRKNVHFYLSFINTKLFHVYEEPKKKVKLYLYAYYSVILRRWFKGAQYYKDDAAFRDDFTNKAYEKFMKLENTFIEVEED